ncbi:MAG: CAP domain-containing protein [Planctomycetota bacterium]|jgi:uncharacterized protein YkwD|nr:CAP domain-containing protein [Planctomycetota bacterium]
MSGDPVRAPATGRKMLWWAIPCLAFLAGCVQWSERASAARGAPARPIPNRAEADDAFRAVNRERIRRGLLPLVRRPDLDAVAQLHARDLAAMDRLSHISSDGRQLERRLSGLDWVWAGENLARNKGFDHPAAEAVRGWLESPRHRENMFRPDFSQAGVAALYDPADGFTYLVQVFIIPAG